MYIFKTEMPVKINQSKACEIIGLAQPTLSNILNGKVACRNVVAFCITKYLDENAKIADYFIKKGE